MSNVPVKKTSGEEKTTLPIFAEIGKRFEEIQRRAFELFCRRGAGLGQDLDDWLKAEREILGWHPVELKENDKAYEIEVALPGFEAKHVEVTAAPEEIAVHAAAEHKKVSEADKVVWTEFGSSEVYRRVALPGPADIHKATAKLEQGLLKIKAPKAEATEEKKVSVAA
jgi:HSP20 family protein